MRYCQLRHVIPLLPQRDEVVVYARLVLPRVVEVEFLCLHIILCQLLLFKLGDFLQEALFLLQRHAPQHNNAIFKQENLRYVHCRVEIRLNTSFYHGLRNDVRVVYRDLPIDGFAFVQNGRCFGVVEVDNVLSPLLCVLLNLQCAV